MDQGQGAVWVGIDIGTTSIKVSVIDENGTELSSTTQNTDADVTSDVGELGYEQCPRTILQVVESTVMSVSSSYHARIKGIGICGQMHGMVLWTKNGGQKYTESLQNTTEPSKSISTSLLGLQSHHNPSRLYTWQDQRCSPPFLATLPPPRNLQLPLSTGHGCATLFWLVRHRGAEFEACGYDCCGTIMDYLVYLLCGLDHPVTSDQLAASLGYFDPRTMGWDSALLDSPEFPSHLMPSVVSAGTRVGVVQSTMTSWPAGVPVVVSMGDVQCAMRAVLKSPQQAAVNISTSIQLGFLVPYKDLSHIQSQAPPSISFFPYSGTHHLALCAGLNGGNAVQHFVECVASWMKDLGFNEDACTPNHVFSKLQALADQHECQGHQNEMGHNHHLKVRPTFYGERHDPTLCGEISHISLTNFQSIGHIYQSVCEGIVTHLGSMVSPSYLCDMNIQELLVCGSVPVKNSFIKKLLKRVYGGCGLLVDIDSINQASSAVGAATNATNGIDA